MAAGLSGRMGQDDAKEVRADRLSGLAALSAQDHLRVGARDS